MVIVLVKYCVAANQVAKKRELHVDFLVKLHEKNVVINAGKKSDGEGGVIILNVQGEEEAKQIMQTDPYYQAGFSAYEYIVFHERFLC